MTNVSDLMGVGVPAAVASRISGDLGVDGDISFASDAFTIKPDTNSQNIDILGGVSTNTTDGPRLQLYGETHPSQAGKIVAISGDSGTYSFGTSGASSIFVFNDNRTTHTIFSDGDWKAAGSATDSFSSFSFSMDDNSKRMKIGGGSDTSTNEGARIILHGKTNTAAKGQLILSAGAGITSTGLEVTDPIVIIETRSEDKVIFRTNDTTRLDIGGDDGLLDFRMPMANSTKDPTTDAPVDWVEIRIGGTTGTSGTKRYLPAYAA